MFCSACGLSNPREANYCFACGAKIFVHSDTPDSELQSPDITPSNEKAPEPRPVTSGHQDTSATATSSGKLRTLPWRQASLTIAALFVITIELVYLAPIVKFPTLAGDAAVRVAMWMVVLGIVVTRSVDPRRMKWSGYFFQAYSWKKRQPAVVPSVPFAVVMAGALALTIPEMLWRTEHQEAQLAAMQKDSVAISNFAKEAALQVAEGASPESQGLKNLGPVGLFTKHLIDLNILMEKEVAALNKVSVSDFELLMKKLPTRESIEREISLRQREKPIYENYFALMKRHISSCNSNSLLATLNRDLRESFCEGLETGAAKRDTYGRALALRVSLANAEKALLEHIATAPKFNAGVNRSSFDSQTWSAQYDDRINGINKAIEDIRSFDTENQKQRAEGLQKLMGLK